MPGLVAILCPPGRQTGEQEIDRMVQSMRHEDFYNTGVYKNQELGVFVGWVAHPGSYSDCNPITGSDGRKILFFHGEHAGDSTEGSDRSSPTAREILALFEKHGHEAIQLLNGWFHGILLDIEQREVLVFNDRYGMQRLFTAESGGARLFAAEAKALLAIRPELRRVDEQALAEWLTCGSTLEDRSLFRNVLVVPQATAWTLRNGQTVAQRPYFSTEEWEQQAPLSKAEFEDRLTTVLDESIRRAAVSSLPLGLSLTGGYDSRLVLAFLASHLKHPPTYTFAGMYRDSFDLKIARQVARLCGCTHQPLEVGANFLRDFPALAHRTAFISDGGLAASNAYELHLNAMARRIAPVRLTGNLGSEVMRGVRAYKAKQPRNGFVHPELTAEINRAISTFDRLGQGNALTFSVFKQAPFLYANRFAVEQSQVIVRTPYMDNAFIKLMYRRPTDAEDGRTEAHRLLALNNSALAELATDIGNCSSARQRVLELLFKADYCYRNGMPQWLEKAHYLMGPLTPERLIRGSHRFAHFRIWYRNELAEFMQDVLLDSRSATRPYFDHRVVREMVRRHIKGDRNYTDEIDKVLSIELMCRSLIDG